MKLYYIYSSYSKVFLYSIYICTPRSDVSGWRESGMQTLPSYLQAGGIYFDCCCNINKASWSQSTLVASVN